MPTTKPTPQEIEAARQMVAKADAEAEAARRAANLKRYPPLIVSGFGPDGRINATPAELVEAMRACRLLDDVARDLSDFSDAAARIFETFADRASTAIQANQPPPTPQTEAA